MKTKLYSHNFAYELLQSKNFQHIYNEIMKVCEECPLPIYKNKSSEQPTLEVVQQIINTYFDIELSSLGWESQPLVTSDDLEDKLKADFIKVFNIPNNYSPKEKFTVIVEVELGNNASYYRDLYKFILSYSQNSADFCVLIVPTKNIATKIDSGVIEFEKPKRELKDARLNFPIPILVIGLDNDDQNIWDTKVEIGDNFKSIVKNKQSCEILVESYINYKKGLRDSTFLVDNRFFEIVKNIDKLEKDIKSLNKKQNKLSTNIENLKLQIAQNPNNGNKLQKKLENLSTSLNNIIMEINMKQNEIDNLKLR